MPQTKSAKKALRQSLKRRLVNLAVLQKLKTETKKFKKNPNLENFTRAQSIIDKAAKKNIISKNKAGRLKSKLSKFLPKKADKRKLNYRLTKKKNPVKLKKINITKNDVNNSR